MKALLKKELKFQQGNDKGGIYSLHALACVMCIADEQTWIEGLGSPCCKYDLEVWHNIGKFLKEIEIE